MAFHSMSDAAEIRYSDSILSFFHFELVENWVEANNTVKRSRIVLAELDAIRIFGRGENLLTENTINNYPKTHKFDILVF